MANNTNTKNKENKRTFNPFNLGRTFAINLDKAEVARPNEGWGPILDDLDKSKEFFKSVGETVTVPNIKAGVKALGIGDKLKYTADALKETLKETLKQNEDYNPFVAKDSVFGTMMPKDFKPNDNSILAAPANILRDIPSDFKEGFDSYKESTLDRIADVKATNNNKEFSSGTKAANTVVQIGGGLTDIIPTAFQLGAKAFLSEDAEDEFLDLVVDGVSGSMNTMQELSGTETPVGLTLDFYKKNWNLLSDEQKKIFKITGGGLAVVADVFTGGLLSEVSQKIAKTSVKVGTDIAEEIIEKEIRSYVGDVVSDIDIKKQAKAFVNESDPSVIKARLKELKNEGKAKQKEMVGVMADELKNGKDIGKVLAMTTDDLANNDLYKKLGVDEEKAGKEAVDSIENQPSKYADRMIDAARKEFTDKANDIDDAVNSASKKSTDKAIDIDNTIDSARKKSTDKAIDIDIDLVESITDIMSKYGKRLNSKGKSIMREILSAEKKYISAQRKLDKLPKAMDSSELELQDKYLKIQEEALDKISNIKNPVEIKEDALAKVSKAESLAEKQKQGLNDKMSKAESLAEKQKQGLNDKISKAESLAENRRQRLNAKRLNNELKIRAQQAMTEGRVDLVKENVSLLEQLDEFSTQLNKEAKEFELKIDMTDFKPEANVPSMSKLHNVAQASNFEQNKVRIIYQNMLESVNEKLFKLQESSDMKDFILERELPGKQKGLQKEITDMMNELHQLEYENGLITQSELNEIQIKTRKYVPRGLVRRDGAEFTKVDEDLVKASRGNYTKSDLNPFNGMDSSRYNTFTEFETALKGTPYMPDPNVTGLYLAEMKSMINRVANAKYMNNLRDIAEYELRPNEIQRAYNPEYLRNKLSIANEEVKRFGKMFAESTRGVNKVNNKLYGEIEILLKKLSESDLISGRTVDGVLEDFNFDKSSKVYDNIALNLNTLEGLFTKLEPDELTNKIRLELLNTKKVLDEEISKVIGDIKAKNAELRKQGLTPISEVTGDITLPSGSGALKGVWVNKTTGKALIQQLKKTSNNSFDTVVDFFKKRFSIGDLFSTPISLSMAIKSRGSASGTFSYGGLNGALAFGGLFVGKAADKLTFGLANKSFRALTGNDIGYYGKLNTYGDGSAYRLRGRANLNEVDTVIQKAKILHEDMNFIEKAVYNADKFLSKYQIARDIIEPIKKFDNQYMELTGAFEKFQYDDIMDPIGQDAWNIYVDRLYKGGVGLEDSKIIAGKMVNSLALASDFGDLMAKNPVFFSRNMQKAMKYAMFSPNMTTASATRIIAPFQGGVGGKVVPLKLAARMAVEQMIRQQLITQGLSYSMNGHSTFENEDKNKIFSLQVPDFIFKGKRIRKVRDENNKITPMKDEMGNNTYITSNLTDKRTFDLINQFGKTSSNKKGIPAAFWEIATDGNPYNETLSKRLWDGVAPVSIQFKTLMNLRKGLLNNEDDYGVVEDAKSALILAGAEAMGFVSSYSDGNMDKASAINFMNEVRKSYDNPDFNVTNLNTFAWFKSWLLNKKIETPSNILFSKYEIKGNTEDMEDMFKFSHLESDAKEAIYSSVTKDKAKKMRQWDITVSIDGKLSKEQLQVLYRKYNILDADANINGSAYKAYERKFEKKIKVKNRNVKIQEVRDSGLDPLEQDKVIREFDKTNLTSEEAEKQKKIDVVTLLKKNGKLGDIDAKEYIKRIELNDLSNIELAKLIK